MDGQNLSPAVPVSPEGFLLSGHYRQQHNAALLVFFGRLRDGRRFEWTITRPRLVFWIPSAQRDRAASELGRAAVRELPLTTMRGESVITLYFRTLDELRGAADRLSQRGIPTLESDVSPVSRHLAEHGIRGSVRFLDDPVDVGATSRGTALVRYRDPRTARGETWLPQLAIMSLDIETSGNADVIYSIAVHQALTGNRPIASDLLQPDGELRRVLLNRSLAPGQCGAPSQLTAGPDTPDGAVEWLPDEAALLGRLEALTAESDPDIIAGWNVIGFDLSILAARARDLASRGARSSPTLALGACGEPMTLRQAGTMLAAQVPGRAVLDAPPVLRSSFVPLPDMRLQTAARELLGQQKAIDPTVDKVAEIERMHREAPLDLAAYNLQDAVLVSRILDRVHAVELLVHRAHNTGLFIDRPGGSVASFDNLYLPKLHRAGAVASDVTGTARGQALGGLVLDSTPGFYDNVIVLDFKSLYPSIIRTFHIDPLGIAWAEREPDGALLIQARGAMVSLHRNFNLLPEIIADLWQKRDEAKARGERQLSQALKIIMNSFYGVLGTPGCRFFDPRISSTITGIGQEVIRTTAFILESSGRRVIYGDTDSVFVHLGPGKDDEAEKRGRELAAEVTAYWKTRLRKELRLESVLELQFDKHYIKFFMPAVRHGGQGSKKRYAGLVRRGAEPEIAFTGLEFVRRDWTALARFFQRDLLLQIFQNKDPEPLVRDRISRLYLGELDDQLVYLKAVRKRLDRYDKTTPPQVRAARLLGRQFEGTWIEYIMTAAGPLPLSLAKGHEPDYDHYLEKQLRPIAEAILPLAGYDSRLLDNPRQLGFNF